MGAAGGDYQTRIHAALRRALAGITLPPGDYTNVRTWVNRELPQLQAAGYSSYLVFGSYRGTYHRSLRIAQYELSKPTTATAVVLGDTPALGLTIGSERVEPLEFEIKFHLLTEFADRNVAIYEKESGGEAVELGLLRQEHCFERTVVLPRDYYGLTPNSLVTKEAVRRVARHIAFAGDVTAERKIAELRGLVATAQRNGVEVTEHELTEFLEEELAAREATASSYSWVHLALFRHFEEGGRCHPWHDEYDLREAVNEVAIVSPANWRIDLDHDDVDSD